MIRKINRKAKALAVAAAKLAGERHCADVVVLDLRKVTDVTDYFVIATGTSDRQMRSVADEIAGQAKPKGFPLFGRAGYERGNWVLLDFVDVVVHIFDSQSRSYYDLEMLWGDAKKLKI
ncbi:MAG: ribosome silencing factor [Sedimentisphaerales bacterium]